MKARITQIGNSIGLILPKEVADRLKVQKGDEVFLTETKMGTRDRFIVPGPYTAILI